MFAFDPFANVLNMSANRTLSEKKAKGAKTTTKKRNGRIDYAYQIRNGSNAYMNLSENVQEIAAYHFAVCLPIDMCYGCSLSHTHTATHSSSPIIIIFIRCDVPRQFCRSLAFFSVALVRIYKIFEYFLIG